MSNRKFKIGDRVRIINCAAIEPYELNKIGTIVSLYGVGDTYVVDMGRPRRNNGETESCWWLRENAIELARKPNEQLLFDFMYQDI